MRKFSLAAFFLAIAFIILSGCGKRDELTVSAAVSLHDPLIIIGDHFQKKFPGIHLTFNFGASGSLSRQIENGAPVDVFISAAEIPMRKLVQSGLIRPETEKVLLTNSLVLVSPADGKRLEGFNDLSSSSVGKIAIGEVRSVPVGYYAKEALQKLGLWNRLEGKMVYSKNALQVKSYVESGLVDAGIVYASDVKQSSHILIGPEIPTELHSPIRYPIGMVNGTGKPEIATRFMEFLTGESAKAIFSAHGFGIVE